MDLGTPRELETDQCKRLCMATGERKTTLESASLTPHPAHFSLQVKARQLHLAWNPLRVSTVYFLQRCCQIQPERGISIYTLLISNNSPTFGYLA